MRFEWDRKKAQSNLKKHGVPFSLATRAFEDPCALSDQDRVVEGEERWQTIGMVAGVLLLVVAHTAREDDGELVLRIISARKATSHERRRYEEES